MLLSTGAIYNFCCIFLLLFKQPLKKKGQGADFTYGPQMPIPGLIIGRRLTETRQCALKGFPTGLSNKNQHWSDFLKSEVETFVPPRKLRKAELENPSVVCWTHNTLHLMYRSNANGTDHVGLNRGKYPHYLAKDCSTGTGCLTKQRTSITRTKTYKIKENRSLI